MVKAEFHYNRKRNVYLINGVSIIGCFKENKIRALHIHFCG